MWNCLLEMFSSNSLAGARVYKTEQVDDVVFLGHLTHLPYSPACPGLVPFDFNRFVHKDMQFCIPRSKLTKLFIWPMSWGAFKKNRVMWWNYNVYCLVSSEHWMQLCMICTIEGLAERTEFLGWWSHQSCYSLHLWIRQCDLDFFQEEFISWKTGQVGCQMLGDYSAGK